jgi:hypothetical protein
MDFAYLALTVAFWLVLLRLPDSPSLRHELASCYAAVFCPWRCLSSSRDALAEQRR